MSQLWHSSTEAGPLRLVSRQTFALESWPQPFCGTCRYKADCRDFLATSEEWDRNYWLVRDRVTTTSDGRSFDQCARRFGPAHPPPDVVVLRHQLDMDLLSFVGKPGEPVKPAREPRLRRPVLDWGES